jgi:hypothetical protein
MVAWDVGDQVQLAASGDRLYHPMPPPSLLELKRINAPDPEESRELIQRTSRFFE